MFAKLFAWLECALDNDRNPKVEYWPKESLALITGGGHHMMLKLDDVVT